jgi:hypothetical protein
MTIKLEPSELANALKEQIKSRSGLYITYVHANENRVSGGWPCGTAFNRIIFNINIDNIIATVDILGETTKVFLDEPGSIEKILTLIERIVDTDNINKMTTQEPKLYMTTVKFN